MESKRKTNDDSSGSYDGFSEREWKDYADDKWSVLPPPGPTCLWDHRAWMSYIYGPRIG